MTGSVVELEGFAFAYPGTERPALCDVDLRIDAGTVVGVAGAEGSGRTTLGMACAGYLPRITGGSTAGRVEVLGVDPRRAGPEEMAGRVAMVFADPESQLTQVHALDEVRSALLNSGVDHREAERRARELLVRVGLDAGAGERRVWQLPRGHQMLLAVAAALATEPGVLVLDGVAGASDPRVRARFAELVRDTGDAAVVVVEDDRQLLARVCDHVVVLADGAVVAQGPPGDLGEHLAPSHLPGDGDRRGASRRRLRSRESRPGGDDGAAPVARLHDVSVRYSDGTRALHGVSLDLHAGRVHALVGGTGAGKTTLLRALGGLVRPSGGRVEIEGRDTADIKVRDLVGTVAAVLSNPDYQITEPTVRDEVAFALRRRQHERTGLFARRPRYDDHHIARRVQHACELAGIDDLADDDPRLVLPARRCLVTLAAAIAAEPALLLLDEPGARLDPTARSLLVAALDALRDRGTAIVLAENDIDLVTTIADEVTVIENGRTVPRSDQDPLDDLDLHRLLDLPRDQPRTEPTVPAQPAQPAPPAQPARTPS